eukprot:m.143627 g.143627  ORF g.143627 m.143627 type:complete len:186 (-) comp16021_c0_seq3:2051-2608(-)
MPAFILLLIACLWPARRHETQAIGFDDILQQLSRRQPGENTQRSVDHLSLIQSIKSLQEALWKEDGTNNYERLKQQVERHLTILESYRDARDPHRTAEDFSCHLHFDVVNPAKALEINTPYRLSSHLQPERVTMTSNVATANILDPSYWVSSWPAKNNSTQGSYASCSCFTSSNHSILACCCFLI